MIDCPAASYSYSNMNSKPVQEMHQHFEKGRSNDVRTVFWRNKTFLMGQLLDICSECTEDCWDGYDAVAVNTKTLLAAKNFISLLPDNIESPDIVPEPSGEIGFEWSKKGLRFLVSIDSETMIYAGVFGEEITHGERKFNNKLPDNIKNTLVEYFNEERF